MSQAASPAVKAATPAADFTLMTWNINGLQPTVPNLRLKYGSAQENSLKSFFSTYNLDACCLQEAKMPEAKMTSEVVCVPGYESFWAVSQTRQSYSGVTTWLRSPPWCPAAASADDLGKANNLPTDLDKEGRVVTTDLGAFVLVSKRRVSELYEMLPALCVNVYVPNAGDPPEKPRLQYKLRFLAALKTRLLHFLSQGKQVIVVGDFNVASERRDLHATFTQFETIYTPQERESLHAITSEFVDVWRRLHPDDVDCYTVWEERTSARAFNAGSRIDYVLVSKGLLDHVISCEILTDLPWKWSDHAPLLLKLRGVQGLGPLPPCDISSRTMTRFNKQAALARMFGGAAQKQTGAKRPREGEHSQATTAAQERSEETKTGTATKAGVGSGERAGEVFAATAAQASAALATASTADAAHGHDDTSGQQAEQATTRAPAGLDAQEPTQASQDQEHDNKSKVQAESSSVVAPRKGSIDAGQAKPQQRSIKSFFQPTAPSKAGQG